MGEFNEYVVYADESGDHGLEHIDPHYPIFVLAFCIFEKSSYVRDTVPAFQQFKFDHFGHDMVVLHERDIRKRNGPFRILSTKEREAQFMAKLTDLVQATEFTAISSVIRKDRLASKYQFPSSPYNLALAFCLERLFLFLKDHSAIDGTTHVVFEQRGRREDQELELVFRRVCSGQNALDRQKPLPFEPIFAPKAANSCGMQLADLVARPIGRNVLNPQQRNRAYEVIRGKLRHHSSSPSRVNGYGIKVFP